MFDILNSKGSGAILLAFFLVITIIVSIVKKNKKSEEIPENNNPLNLNDFDATVACLIASIEARDEEKCDVRIINVREIN